MNAGATVPAIAIVGMACELPGAASPEALWENALAGRRAFRRIPAERLDLGAYGDADPSVPDRTYSTQAAVLEGYHFDRRAFRIPPEVHRAADPAHWLALDVAARALADAGFAGGAGLPVEATGVIVGNTLTGEVSRAAGLRLRWPYVQRLVGAALAREGWADDRRASFLDQLEADFKRPFPPVTEDTLPGGLANTIAGRIAGHFDLKGGGFVVDGACASSLLAIIHACEALAAGRMDCAIAGGVDLSLDPFELVGFAKAGALAREAMRVYDAAPTGFWPGEGCGMLVLMRLADARAAGHPVHAILRGWGIASDGAGGITRPEEAGQRLALERAYRTAGIDPLDVDYIEGHGTGTAVGDAVELAALSALRWEAGGEGWPGDGSKARRHNGFTSPRHRATGTAAAIGSVKALIGHTKAAAGVAGLLKAVMAVRAGILPPTIGCETPHPLLREPGAALRVLGAAEPWPDRPVRRAGVSGFGFGGINTHVVVEAPDASETTRSIAPAPIPTWSARTQDAELLLFAADSRDALASQLARTGAYAAALSLAELGDLAAALAREAEAAGSRARWRAALVAGTPEETADGIAEILRHMGQENHIAGSQEQGPEHPLWLNPFAGTFLAAPSPTRPGRIAYLFPGQGSPIPSGGAWARRFPRLAAAFGGDQPQPALVSASLAALDVLSDLGVTADVAVGHSLGELTALHWSGALAAADLVRLAEARGRAMAAVESPGTMAAIGADAGAVAPILTAIGDPRLVVAGLNGPRQTVIAGPVPSLRHAVEAARSAGLHATPLPVAGAFHSPLMAPARPALAHALADIPFRRPRCPVVSTITGTILDPATDLPEILLQQLTLPVRFAEALATAADGVSLLIEVGPGRVLGDLARGQLDAPVVSIDAGGPSLRGLLSAAGAAFAIGGAVPSALFADRLFRPFALDWAGRFLENPCESRPLPVHAQADSMVADQLQYAPTTEVDRTINDQLRDRRPTPCECPLPLSGGGQACARGTTPATPDAACARTPGGGLSLLRAILARRLDLPLDRVHAHDRFRADLHLSSIALAEILAEASVSLGVAPPTTPTDYATASLEEAAAALAARPDASADDSRPPAGVAAWVRPFRIEWAAAEPPAQGHADPGKWRVVTPDDFAFGRCLAEALASRAPREGVVAVLPPGDDHATQDLLIEAARTARTLTSSRLLVVHSGSAGAPAFARCLGFEGIEVACVDVPYDDPRAVGWVLDEALAAVPAVEVRWDAAGLRRVPRLEVLWPGLDSAQDDAVDIGRLTPGDVLLVTGGGKGIGSEAALALALHTGASLGLVGRSPLESDPVLAQQLERFAAHGVRFAYQVADVTDGDAIRQAVRRIGAELGRVTAVLHAAGRNEPRLAAELDAGEVERTVAPKVAGLAHVLAALADHPPRWLLTFGSVIARTGLAGEAHYALANALLRRATEDFAQAHPSSRSLCIEWSVWSGIGMGERLGSIEALDRQGIAALAVDEALRLLVDLMDAGATGSVVVAGRLGDGRDRRIGFVPPTSDLPLARFLEQPRVWLPGVELVADARLSADTDPYLADHVLDGTPLFPAVLGLEAMTQAVAALTGWSQPLTFRDVAFRQAIPVPAATPVTLRVAALARAPDCVDVVLRTDSTGFAVDHMRATVHRPPGAPASRRHGLSSGLEAQDGHGDCRRDAGAPRNGGSVPAEPLGESPSSPTLTDLYGSLLFQRGRLRRLRGYRRLAATACDAEIEPRPAGERWFGPFLPQNLHFADPASRDAALQALQACVPHRRVLPVGVDEVRVYGPADDGPLMVRAVERAVRSAGPDGRGEAPGDYCFDLELRDPNDRLIEGWTGLRLRAVGDLPPPAAWPTGLLGPYLERRLGELGGQVIRARVFATSDAPTPRDTPSARGIYRPDGKPEHPGFLPPLSRSRAGGLTLEVRTIGTGASRPGCDVETVGERPWADLIGADGIALAGAISAEAGDPIDQAATRVWAAREAVLKAGWPRPPTLTLESATDDGWVLLRGGQGIVATAALTVRDPTGRGAPLVFAFAGPSAPGGPR